MNQNQTNAASTPIVPSTKKGHGDVSSGLAFGGNKIRKLEWLAADALAQGCDTLVSIGNIQSNHTRQVAAVAAVLGLKCRLIQEEWTKWDDPAYSATIWMRRQRQSGWQCAVAVLR
jgi:1-aminocyclopropane-1-carboxylate deaminase/D-cysteine desulfhydrase-like pyridoxal-dependent ACC family enzyme